MTTKNRRIADELYQDPLIDVVVLSATPSQLALMTGVDIKQIYRYLSAKRGKTGWCIRIDLNNQTVIRNALRRKILEEERHA